MNAIAALYLTAAVALLPLAAAAATPTAPLPLLMPEQVNDAALTETVGPKARGAAALRAQVLLERARFSSGEIDAIYGSNMRVALIGFQKNRRLRASGTVDAATWAELNRDTAPVLLSYTLTEADVAGPFAAIPADMMAKAQMTTLGYASSVEALGERFHASPKLLLQLNPGKDLARAGEAIVVPDVEPSAPMATAAKLVIDKSDSIVFLVDAQGRTIAQFPASTGSRHDPLPIGKWKVKGVGNNPVFHYNPKLFWDADPEHAKARIPAGPNNPVGLVWIDLSKEHYGIHGTPEPSKISKTESHGCIRMTNWSAVQLSLAVSPGLPAILRK